MKTEDIILLHHKLDLLLWALSGVSAPQEAPKPIPGCGGMTSSNCPLCKSPVYLNVDPIKGEVSRRCSCSLGVTSTGPSPLLQLLANTHYSIGKDHKDE